MGKHLSGAGKQKARLQRSRDYRKNGYKHIKGNGGRKSVYADLDVIQGALQTLGTGVRGKGVTAGSKAHARRYTFTYGNNFRIGKSPYANQGHHLLPEEAFLDKFFDSNQLRMLQGVDYNINNGENIIFLPARLEDTAFHLLPFHQGRHPAYTEKVDADMEQVRDVLDKALAKDKKHKQWNPPEDLKDRLMNLQKDYWDMLVAAGPISINEFVKPTLKKKGLTKSKKS
ncbi:AHH domain-containing protein [Archangium violaceum]|uniref:AHH domain-containing protein n=1 Tax=Archangium violaceum TaxID=83451 RepID=UPI000696DBDF|nr:AHH domain-containing protein [Archangium violaceum]